MSERGAGEASAVGSGSSLRLVVGLGNPGRRYAGTRHNTGFLVVGELGRQYGTGPVRERFQGDVMEGQINGTKVLFLAPGTCMNRSGRSVLAARDFYRLPPESILVISDDVSLPVGQLRFRAGGSSGGQKGLGDIIRCLGTDRIPRLRIGIGSPPPRWEMADYVLSQFTKEELPEMERAVVRAAQAVTVWVNDGPTVCMNRYNMRGEC
ncbi:MAG: aminoacyl-tRNA hydrolase [Planctomycetia bacterium]|nr:aminoacyl-tRNA hydrolase [Planctomycetia bacterium]